MNPTEQKLREALADELLHAGEINQLQRESIHKVHDLIKTGSKFIDIHVRKDGREYHFEADWLRQMLNAALAAPEGLPGTPSPEKTALPEAPREVDDGVTCMRVPKRIPISTAKMVAEKHGLKQVILLGYDGDRAHVVTYGVTKADCEAAAKAQDFWTGKIREFSFDPRKPHQ